MPKYRVVATLVLEVEITGKLADRSKDQDFVDDFYSLDTPEKIAEHLAWNLGIQNRDLTDLDGFADLETQDASVDIIDGYYETREV